MSDDKNKSRFGNNPYRGRDDDDDYDDEQDEKPARPPFGPSNQNKQGGNSPFGGSKGGNSPFGGSRSNDPDAGDRNDAPRRDAPPGMFGSSSKPPERPFGGSGGSGSANRPNDSDRDRNNERNNERGDSGNRPGGNYGGAFKRDDKREDQPTNRPFSGSSRPEDRRPEDRRDDKPTPFGGSRTDDKRDDQPANRPFGGSSRPDDRRDDPPRSDFKNAPPTSGSGTSGSGTDRPAGGLSPLGGSKPDDRKDPPRDAGKPADSGDRKPGGFGVSNPFNRGGAAPAKDAPKDAGKPADSGDKKPGGGFSLGSAFNRGGAAPAKDAPKDAGKPADSGDKKPGGGFNLGNPFNRGGNKPEEKKDDKSAPAASASPRLNNPPPAAAKPGDKPADSSDKKPGFLGGFAARLGGGSNPGDKKDDKKDDKPGSPRLAGSPGDTSNPRATGTGGPGAPATIKPLAPAGAPAPKPADRPADKGKDPKDQKDVKPAGGGVFGGVTGLFNRNKPSAAPVKEDKATPKLATPTAAGSGAPAMGAGAAKPAASKPANADKKDAKKDEKPGGGGLFGLFGRGKTADSKADSKAVTGNKAAATATNAKIDPKKAIQPPGRDDKKPAAPLVRAATKLEADKSGLSLDQKLDITGYALMFGALVVVGGLLQPNEGYITSEIAKVLGQLFGYGRYIVPFVMFGAGSWLLIRRFQSNPFLVLNYRRIFGMLFLFVSVIATLQFVEMLEKYVETMDQLDAASNIQAVTQLGGGWLGHQLYMMMMRFAGEWGIVPILALALILGFLFSFDITLGEIALGVKSVYRWFARIGKGRAEVAAVNQEKRAVQRQLVEKTQMERMQARLLAEQEKRLKLEQRVQALKASSMQVPQVPQLAASPTLPAGLTPAAATGSGTPALAGNTAGNTTGSQPAKSGGFRLGIFGGRNKEQAQPAASVATTAPVPTVAPIAAPLQTQSVPGMTPAATVATDPLPSLKPTAPPPPIGKGKDKRATGRMTAVAAPTLVGSDDAPPVVIKPQPAPQPISSSPASAPAATVAPVANEPVAPAKATGIFAVPAAPSPTAFRPVPKPVEAPKPTPVVASPVNDPVDEPARDDVPAIKVEDAPKAATSPFRPGGGSAPFGARPPVALPSPASKPVQVDDEDEDEAPIPAKPTGIFSTPPIAKPSPVETAKPAPVEERDDDEDDEENEPTIQARPAAAVSPFGSRFGSPASEPAKPVGSTPAPSGIFGSRKDSNPVPTPKSEPLAPRESTPVTSSPAASTGSVFGSRPSIFGSKSTPAASEPPVDLPGDSLGATRQVQVTQQINVVKPDDAPLAPVTEVKAEPTQVQDNAPAEPQVDLTPAKPAGIAPKPAFGSTFGGNPFGARPAPKPVTPPADDEDEDDADKVDNVAYVPTDDAIEVAKSEPAIRADEDEDDRPLPMSPKPAFGSPFSSRNASPLVNKPISDTDTEDEEVVDADAEVKVPAGGPIIRTYVSEAVDVPTPPAFSRGEFGWPMPNPADLLNTVVVKGVQEEKLRERGRDIEDTLREFGAPGKVVEINAGPTITQYGVEPDYLVSRGKKTRVKVSSIAKLSDDIALALAAKSIRIEAPVPGKSYVGIEVPNQETAVVGLRDLMLSSEFHKVKSKLRIVLGKSVDGAPIVADLTAMPHVLIAGTTGSGKSVCVNAIITCLLLENSPDDLKMIMVDPKRVELTGYNGIPHLVQPVVVDPERIVGVLKWVTREMDERYKKFQAAGARNLLDFNSKIAEKEPNGKLPYLVVIIDELADLMMLAPEETEKVLTRLAQMARATGIHLIISTQRPSVDVVTGLIKANFPARISFAVASGTDSRVILDSPGAEKLLGRGDMLYQAPDAPAPIRMQGVYVSDMEIERVTRQWKTTRFESGSGNAAPVLTALSFQNNEKAEPVQTRAEKINGPFSTQRPGSSPREGGSESGNDEDMYQKAVELYQKQGTISVPLLQRNLRIGFATSQKLMDMLRQRGVIPSASSRPGSSDSKPPE